MPDDASDPRTAERRNPALADLAFLVGAWTMKLSGAAFLPDPDTTVGGVATIAWIEGGAALAMRQGEAATWIIGRDDSEECFRVLYADARGVSRAYGMSFGNAVWQLWRTTPAFSQRFEAAVSVDRRSIRGRWEKSFDGGTTWEHDFDIAYTR